MILKYINKSSIKVISFDVTDTIIRLKLSPALIYKKIGDEYKLNLNEKMIESKFKDSFKKYQKVLPNYGYKKGGSKVWWSKVIYESCGIEKNPITEEFCNQCYEEFNSSKYYELINDKTPEILGKLGKQYTLIVTSNSDERIKVILRELLKKEYFNDYIISSENGYGKPDARVFQKICEKFNCLPENIIHIGDNIIKDYNSIEKFGGHGILFSNNDKYNSISSLNQLTEIL
uniref:Haloacid dehalogenase-like hydrolase domain-containing protein 3 n=1 Tax=Parastrongyloides trichosuri TaxID=131310 RepID=A0A0N4Z202_PARTI